MEIPFGKYRKLGIQLRAQLALQQSKPDASDFDSKYQIEKDKPIEIRIGGELVTSGPEPVKEPARADG